MDVMTFTDNFFSKELKSFASNVDAKIILQAQEATTVASGLVRGGWIFGVEIFERGETKRLKMVSSSTAKICQFTTLTGVAAKITRLGFSVVKIPCVAGQQVNYCFSDLGPVE